MPLSDREQQILSDIEQRLRAEDPRLLRAGGKARSAAARRAQQRLAVIGFVVGLVLLLGIVVDLWFGIVGAALMLASAIWGATRGPVGAGLGRLRGGVNRYLEERHGREDGHPSER